jgi:hypothetical protein
MIRLLRVFGAWIVFFAGFTVLCLAAWDGKFNGADLAGWVLLILGLMRIFRPVPVRQP